MGIKEKGNVKKNILLALASAFITFFVLVILYEVYQNVRYYRFKAFYRKKGDLYGNLTIASPNEKLIWEYRPNGVCQSKRKEYKGELKGTIRTNRYGFRDYDYASPDKEEGVNRVAFIGDSVTLGLWVDFDEIFVKRFEVKANKLSQDQKIQALNFSVDGYNTLQIHEMLKARVLPFSPDQVVYVMCLNDFDLHEAAASKIYYFRKPKSFFLKRIKELFHRTERPEKEDYYFFHYHRNKMKAFTKILEMRNMLNPPQIDFLVVIMPIFDFGEGFANYPYTKIHAEIKNFLSKREVRVFDLLEVFEEKIENPCDYAYDVWHPNPKGHRLMARALLEPVLKAEGVIP
ncbi:MAG: SGNH/GDSL hydrolase family protein [Candidatus Aminicenantes bacterium]